MDDYSTLKHLLKAELNKITAKGDLSPNELENATKVMCLLEKIAKVERGETEDEGYSERRYPMPYSRDDASYMRRDSRGRYSRSDENGYSMHSSKEHMIRRLELMLDEAPSDRERAIISECMEKLER